MRAFARPAVFAALALAIGACGGGDNDDVDELLGLGLNTPTATSPAVSGGGTATVGTAVRTPTPADPDTTPTPYPSGPEGAVHEDTISRGRVVTGEVSDAGPWVTPLLAWDSIGSEFAEDRGEPLVHGGIDFRVDSTPGVDVYAVCDGWVAGIEYSETHGRYIVLKCPEKWTVVYGFMEIVDVAVNDTVVKGETVLGTVDTFLHFEMRWDFRPIDPDTQLQYHVRPRGVLLDPTPTPTVFEPTDVPEDTPTPPPTNTPATGGGGGGGGGTEPTATSTPTPSAPPAATPTPTNTPTNTPTPEPTPTPTPKPPTPTPTPLPQAF